jgi:hypothetical protein
MANSLQLQLFIINYNIFAKKPIAPDLLKTILVHTQSRPCTWESSKLLERLYKYPNVIPSQAGI